MSRDQIWLFKSSANESDIDAVTNVLERGTWWALGPEIDEFEEKVAARTGCKYGIAFNSGTSALYAALSAHDVEGGEVIVPSFTYPATTDVAVAAGAEPVFADIERDSLALDASSVRERMTEDTRAIMPIHFAGDVCADIYELQTIAAEYDVPLIEDAAHSLGADYDGDPVGSFGEAATFSFAPNKTVTTGEGGMLVTDSERVKDRAKRLSYQGHGEEKRHAEHGYNLQLSSFTAALGVSQVSRLDEIVSKRREMATYLNDRLGGLDDLLVPTPPASRNRVYLYYNIRLASTELRDALQAYLDEQGIMTRVTYEPVHLTEYYRTEWGWSDGELPVTEDVSSRILTLPFHLELDESDLDYVADHVESFLTDYDD